MSVYVDPLINYGVENAPRCFRCKPSCHMYADTLEELHSMAAAIGLKRDWFQDDSGLKHYDLTPPKRIAAVRCGAIEHTSRQMVEFMQEQNNSSPEIVKERC